MSLEHAPAKGLSDRFLWYVEQSFNVGELPEPAGKAQMVGQCGDSIGVHVFVENDKLDSVRVQPEGCVYTQVCAGAMSCLAQGLTVEEALRLEPDDIAKEVGGLPEDHLHCARLALNSLGEAIADYYAGLGARGVEEET